VSVEIMIDFGLQFVQLILERKFAFPFHCWLECFRLHNVDKFYAVAVEVVGISNAESGGNGK
jgi:hypothetical protein